MALETANYVGGLVATNPTAADPKSQGDDHLRLIKAVLLNSFSGFSGGVVCTGTDGGAADAYTVTPSSALPGYASRLSVVFSPIATNATPTPTLNVSGIGAINIKRIDGSAPVAGDLVAGSIYIAIHNGSEFRLLAPTKQYIDQLAFGTALPAQSGKKLLVTNGAVASWAADQTGNTGKFLTTDGSNPSWSYAGISTINSTITTNTTLTGTYLYVPVQMASMGQSVTLPSANTLSAGGPQYVIDNTKGGYPCGIRDNTGTLIMAVAAGGEAFVSLKDNSTAAGAWSVTGSNLEPGLITIDNTFSSTYASTVLAPFVALDSNTSIHFAALATGFAAFVVDNAGKVLTTPVTVTTVASPPYAAFKISQTQAIVFYEAGGTAYGVVLTVSGASPSLSLAVGTATNAGAELPFSQEGTSSGAPKIVQLSSSLYLSSWTNGTNTKVIA
ncbi:MAG: hypothetical protein KGP14_00975, partial [Betaproteobacteria bacterium]|nr:hypothetical protein [Betaproteobacteria bacterium]